MASHGTDIALHILGRGIQGLAYAGVDLHSAVKHTRNLVHQRKGGGGHGVALILGGDPQLVQYEHLLPLLEKIPSHIYTIWPQKCDIFFENFYFSCGEGEFLLYWAERGERNAL